jgi:dihydrofolate synthase/folylpolyglutamate synthase
MRAFEVVEAARRDVSLTYFEFTTLAAFHLLGEAGLDAAVLEVGLGGRLDAVNLVDADCAVLTVIGLDHQDYLGCDRESIGFEKAGIMRAGRPVVCGDRSVPTSVTRHARTVGAGLVRIGREFDVREAGEELELRLGERCRALPRPPLQGGHQFDNLAAALAALDTVFGGLLEQDEVVRRGIAATRLPGRLQRCGLDRRILLDVGHNPLAARVVREFLQAVAPGRRHCVLGMLADKDAEGVARELDPVVDAWWCAGLHGSRGQAGQQLAERIGRNGLRGAVASVPEVADGLTGARAAAGPDDTILVFGSFETVAAAMRHLDSEAVHDGSMLIES